MDNEMHDDYSPFGFPYKTLSTGRCYDCSRAFPIHENIMVEVRCAPCQAKYRIEQANKKHETVTDNVGR